MEMSFLDFITTLFNSVSAFLLTEPISYFTAIAVLICVASFVKKICNGRW